MSTYIWLSSEEGSMDLKYPNQQLSEDNLWKNMSGENWRVKASLSLKKRVELD